MPAFLLVAAALAAETVTVQTPAVAAAGTHSTLFTVPAFGRYALSAESAQGTAVQLVTRASGPGAPAGVAGEKNGRLDVFLDRGEYKLVAVSDPAGTGQARVQVRPFSELNLPAVALPPLQTVSTSLGDLQQRTWWVQGGRLEVEAAGRSLADLRVWRDGTWLVDVAPSCTVETPRPGRDLRRCTLSATVDEGLYAVVAYGGASLAWSEGGAEQPLHIRVGIPPLPSAGRQSHLTSPFGVDRWLLPRTVERVSLALPAPGDASMTVRPHDEDPFGPGSSARVRKESLPPQVGLPSAAGSERVLTVRAAAGAPYTLAWFPAGGGVLTVPRTGHWFLATLPDGSPGDSLDATLIVGGRKPTDLPVAASPIRVAPDTVWGRRFNLLSTASLLLDVTTPGVYEVGLRGVEAEFRVEPLWIKAPEGYVAPALRGPGRVDLEAGYYRLSLVPTTAGIVEASIRPGGWSDRLKDAVGLSSLPAQELRAGAQFPDLLLEKGSYPLVSGLQPGVSGGVVLRALPLDLDDALPIWLGTAPVEVSVQASAARRLQVTAEDGRPIEVSVDGGPWGSAAIPLTAGPHRVAVRHGGTEPVYVSLATLRPEMLPGAPLPAAPPLSLPDFPVLGLGAAQSGDLAGEDTDTYAVAVDHAALVRLETTGLLGTEGVLRTRTATRLLAARANGIGRNFLLQTWLGEGDYQLSVAPVAPSVGHYGVRLLPVAFRDGGPLADGLAARAALGADEGVAYTVRIDREGDFALHSYGPGRSFRLRFEDADGFPLAEPEVTGPRTWHLAAGTYRVVLLPEAVPSRRITELVRAPEPVARNGHGPHVIHLGEQVSHVWWETDPRAPDVWELTVPAPVQATLEVDAEMVATLFRDGVQVARTVPGETWSGPLAAGAWRIETMNGRRNSGVAYQLGLRAEELVAGTGRDVQAPVILPVSIGAAGTYAFTSRGDRDVRATLLSDGRVVAVNDDRPEDWNFALREPLQAGRYELKIDPVGGSTAPVHVDMSAPADTEAPALVLGRPVRLSPGVDAQVLPLATPAGGLLVVGATSAENLGLALEQRLGSAWEPVGVGSGRAAQVVVRLGGAPGQWRVRLWSMDGRRVPADLRADVVQPLRTTESAFRSGFGVGVVKVSAPAFGAAVIKADHAGLFTIETASGTSWCPRADRACVPLPSGQVPAALGELWLLRSADAGTSFRGRRVVVDTTPTPVAADAADTALDVARAGGFAVVLAEGGLLVDAGGGGGGRWDRGTALAKDGSVALSLDPQLSTIRVRARSPELRPVAEGHVRVVRFPQVIGGTLSEARVDGQLAPGAARRMVLLPGTEGVRVVAGDGVVVARVEGAQVGTVLLGPVDALLPGSGGELMAFNVGEEPGTFLFDTLAAGSQPLALTPQVPVVERVSPTAGTLVLGVSGRGFVHVRGARTVSLLRADGRVLEGRDLALDPVGGQLRIQHAAGPLLAWVDEHPVGGAAAFGPHPAAPPVALGPGGTVRALSEPITSVGFTPGAPRLVHLRVEPGLLARIEVGGRERVELVPEDGTLDVVTDGTPVRVDLRRVGGGPLAGLLRAETLAPEPLGDGLGPVHLFGAGDSRLYQFEVPARQLVGLGVRAGADALVGTLLDAAGAPIGAGYVQMPELTPGRYGFLLHLPGGAAPVEARPALVGLVRPDAGPPADVVRTYVESAP